MSKRQHPITTWTSEQRRSGKASRRQAASRMLITALQYNDIGDALMLYWLFHDYAQVALIPSLAGQIATWLQDEDEQEA